MDIDFTPEQQVLREMVRGVVQEHAPLEVVRRMEDDPKGYPPAFWKQLAEVGVLGVLIPEEYGGAAQTLLEAAVVYEEFGRGLAPSPHLPSSVVGGGVLLGAGSEAQRREWLPKLCDGSALLTPAWLEPDRGFGPVGVQLRAERDGRGYRLSGTKRHVPFASAATRLVVLARTGPGERDVDLLLVDPNAEGVKLTQQLTIGSDTQYQVEIRDVRVPESARIGAPGSGWASFERVMHDAIILVAAQAMGGAERALEITVEYAKVRKQFDKPLAAFQAISHYLADGATQVDGGRTLVYEAAWARSVGRDVTRLAPMAKLFACQTFRDVTAMCQQVWGGVGFTVEYDIQLYFRRAKQLQLSWWDTRYLEELVASSVLDAGQPVRV
jgi:alkylation response protein AidB-like acyl-CoA dehydrogenase